jgi:hypothetical protein
MMHSVVADDFNSQSGSRFYKVFIQYCGQMTLICSFQISNDQITALHSVVIMDGVLPG